MNCHAGLSAGTSTQLQAALHRLPRRQRSGRRSRETLFEDTTQPLPKYPRPRVDREGPRAAQVAEAGAVLLRERRRRRRRRQGRRDRRRSSTPARTQVRRSVGEVFEPQLHGEGAGEFIDTELSARSQLHALLEPRRPPRRDDRLRRRAIARRIDGGGVGGCHQQTIDVVRRSIMVNQSRGDQRRVLRQRELAPGRSSPRAATRRIRAPARSRTASTTTGSTLHRCRPTERHRPVAASRTFDSACLEARASSHDPGRRGGRTGQRSGLAGVRDRAGYDHAGRRQRDPGQTLDPELGAGDTRYRGAARRSPMRPQERAKLAPVLERRGASPGSRIRSTSSCARSARTTRSTIRARRTTSTSRSARRSLPDILRVQDREPVRPRSLVGLLGVPRPVQLRRRARAHAGATGRRHGRIAGGRSDDQAPRVPCRDQDRGMIIGRRRAADRSRRPPSVAAQPAAATTRPAASSRRRTRRTMR